MSFFEVVNIYGLVFMLIMAAPHVVYARTHSYDVRGIENRGMVYIERIGKYCGAFLMAINLGVLEEGFTSELMKNFWLIAVSVLVAIYILLWVIFFKNGSKGIAYALTVVAAVVLMLSGLLQVKTLLLTAGIVYLIGELYVTSKVVKL